MKGQHPVRPSFKTGLHCGVGAEVDQAHALVRPPVLQDGPPLRRRDPGAPPRARHRSARPSRRASIAARWKNRTAPPRSGSARPSRRASIAAPNPPWCRKSLRGPPVLQDGPPLRRSAHGRVTAINCESARPSRRASIAARGLARAAAAAVTVRPSFKTGLHCGRACRTASCSMARVRPSFKTGLHCGVQAACDQHRASGVRPSFKTGLHCGRRTHVLRSASVRSARPSRRASIAATSSSTTSGSSLTGPPVLQDGPPLRRC
ncbi:MAG: hypothetical protein QOE45_1128 [Frankiaceae bacterium]|nr:hypothetical protein [Frankiaceae bacterium]